MPETDKEERKEGGVRLLTLGEIALATSQLFDSTIKTRCEGSHGDKIKMESSLYRPISGQSGSTHKIKVNPTEKNYEHD